MGIFNSFLHTTEELISYTYMDLSNSLDGYRRDYCYRSTPEKIYEASAIYVVCKIPLRVIGFHPEEKYIWHFRYSSLIQDSSSGYWFSPRRELYKGSFSYPNFMQDSPSAYRFSPRSKLSYRWKGYVRFSQRFTWHSVLLNCSQPIGFLSDNSGTYPKVGPGLWGQPFALYLLR